MRVKEGARRSLRALRDRARDVHADLRYRWWSARHASRHRSRRVLLIDELLPIPTFGAGYPRANQIVRALIARGWRVVLCPMASEKADRESIAATFGDAARALRGDGEAGLSRFLRAHAHQFDLVVVSRPEPMRAFERIMSASPSADRRPPVVYDAEAIVANREIMRRDLFGPPMTAAERAAAIDAELACARIADAVWTVTPPDAAQFAAGGSTASFVVSHGVAVNASPPPGGRSNLLFVGRLTGDPLLSPNVDSLIWFVEEVMPELDRLIGRDYLLRIVGIADRAIRARLEGERVVFEGVVDDVRPLYDASRLFVAPTRFAHGLPLKLCEALGMGLPCVATGQLVDQLGLTLGREIEGAGSDDPRAFAAACARLYTDDARWSAIQAAGSDAAARLFSIEAFQRSVGDAATGTLAVAESR